jgi:hypothetical protein
MSKADRILGQFPHFYRAAEPGKLLGEVVRALARPLEEADTHLFRIQRAHRLNVADQPLDIVRLAAALGLTAFHFEDLCLEAAGSAEERRAADERRLEMMRDRVRRIARLYLLGLGTPWAVIEAAAIFLNARIVPDRPGDPLVRQIDPQGFSHRATVAFHHLPGQPREQIVLHENPLLRQKVDPAERWPLNTWAVENRNVDAADTIFAIEGIGEHTVLPSIFCPAIQAGIQFYGIVPEGMTLIIDAAGGARLDGTPVDDWLVSFQGGLTEFSLLDGAQYSVDDGSLVAPFDGNLEDLVIPAFREKRGIPQAPIGRTDWYFKVADGVYDGSLYDFCVFDTPPEPVGEYDDDPGFDASVFDYPASAVVGMAWDGRVPCAFKLLLPAHLPEEALPNADQSFAGAANRSGTAAGGQSAGVNYLGRIGSILPRFKAAGVRAYVDMARDAWILGASVVRGSQAAEGEGVDFHATRPRSLAADQYIA